MNRSIHWFYYTVFYIAVSCWSLFRGASDTIVATMLVLALVAFGVSTVLRKIEIMDQSRDFWRSVNERASAQQTKEQ